MTQRILVTGASGLLGNRLGSVLGAAGHHVVGTFHGHPDRVWSTGFASRVSCDLSSEVSIRSLWSQDRFDTIVHCAAFTNVNRCEEDHGAAHSANVVATRNIAALAREHRARVIYISTSSVFDGHAGNYVESDVPNPCNYYSWTKLLGEESVRAAGATLIVRATLIGLHPRREGASNFIEWLLGSLRAGKDISLFDDIRINPLSDVSLAGLVEKLLARDFDQPVLHAGTIEPWSKAAIGQSFINRIPTYRGTVTVTSSDAAGGNGARRAKEMWLNVDRLTALDLAPTYTVSGELDRIAEYALMPCPQLEEPR